MTKNKWRIIFYTSISFIYIIYNHARPLWHPIKLRLTGQRTLAEVIKTLEGEQSVYWQDLLKKKKVDLDKSELYLIALKEERLLEVWLKGERKSTKLCTYPFTAFSGELGPKIAEGDGQIPEGIYKISSLNPNSSYHLSMKIDYPNEYDKAIAKDQNRTDLGSNIFIHGKSVTIGCIHIGDKNIESLFYLVQKVGINRVTVLISPRDFRIEKCFINHGQEAWIKHKYHELNKKMSLFTKSECVNFNSF